MSTIVVLGGSGFIGKRLVEKLVTAGHHVIVPSRNREAVKGSLIVLPNTDVVACNPFEPRTLAKLVSHADVVINLVGILHETRRHSFETVLVENVRRLVDSLANADHVRQLLHVSALNATTGAPSRYLRSKGKGESLVTKMRRTPWTIVRPSVVFGQGDGFLTLFARLLKMFPLLMLPLPRARFQPIWVDDLAEMIVACVGNSAAYGKTYNAAGPAAMEMGAIVSLLMQHVGPRRPVIPCGETASRLLALVLENIPFIPTLLTRDNLDSMSIPNECDNSSNDAARLVAGRLVVVEEYLIASRNKDSHFRAYSDYRHVARHN